MQQLLVPSAAAVTATAAPPANAAPLLRPLLHSCLLLQMPLAAPKQLQQSALRGLQQTAAPLLQSAILLQLQLRIRLQLRS